MAEMEQGVPQPDNPEVHHETTDVNVRTILWFAFWFVVVAAVIHLLIWGIYSVFERVTVARQGPPISRVGSGPRVPPSPRLQVLGANPVVEMRKLREQEEQILGSYAVVNPATGSVRIPIDDAMRIALQRPEMFPVRAAEPASATPAAGAQVPAVTTPVSGAGLPMQARPIDEPEQLPLRENAPAPQQQPRP